MDTREFRLALLRVFPRNPPESIRNLGEIRDGHVIDRREKTCRYDDHGRS